MKICEDCIKQEVCKFKEQVEGYENKIDLPNPLEPIIQCKHKRTEPSSCTYTAADCDVTYTGPWIYPTDGTDCVHADIGDLIPLAYS